MGGPVTHIYSALSILEPLRARPQFHCLPLHPSCLPLPPSFVPSFFSLASYIFLRTKGHWHTVWAFSVLFRTRLCSKRTCFYKPNRSPAALNTRE